MYCSPFFADLVAVLFAHVAEGVHTLFEAKVIKMNLKTGTHFGNFNIGKFDLVATFGLLAFR